MRQVDKSRIREERPKAMKTADYPRRNSSVWLWTLSCLTVTSCIVGCNEQARLLQSFDGLEEEALKYGMVSAGAARVREYNSYELRRSRECLKEALCRMRCKWLKDPNYKPQGYWVDSVVDYVKLALSFKMSQSNSEPNKAQLADLSEALKAKLGSQPPRASEIELIGYYMAAQKFVESELEELSVGEPADPDFRRFVVSLDLTAWVRDEAKAALVYIDLYPYEADTWCLEAAEIMDVARGKGKYKVDWRKTLKDKLGAFAFKDLKNLAPPMRTGNTGLGDRVAECHRWLEKYKLRPRIVQVERMGQGEYLISGEGSYSSSEFQLGGVHPAGFSGSLGAGTSRKAEGVTAKVLPLSLAFVAGERRAGWLFMPGKTTEGRMAPTERRLRMVVDVPKKMKKLSIHVHKLFLGADFGILQDSAFSKQLKDLDRAYGLLPEADKLYWKRYKKGEPRHFRLIMTRMRSLLHQGWSEETVVDIPDET